MNIGTGRLIAAAFCLGFAQPTLAEGLTLQFEGGLTFNQGAGVGVVSIVRDAPATDTSLLDFQPGLSRGPLSLSYRAEANWAFDLGNGTQMRIGGILSGQEGSRSEVTPVYGLVFTQPGGPEPGLPQAEIRVCDFPNPCATFDGELRRSYHEVMPELMFGRQSADGRSTWYGLQGFWGSLDETTSNRSFREPPAIGAFDQTTLTDLEADAEGLMLAVQHARPMASGMTLVLGAGLGGYRMDASGFSIDPAEPLGRKDVAGEIDGIRAQLMVGVEKPLSDRLTLGATARMDHWTDQPRIQMDWTEPPCSPTLCEPPGRDGNFTLATDPFTSVTFGVSLTLRM